MVSRFNWRRILIAFSAILLFGGCASRPQNLTKSTPKVVFFSTNAFKFYDTGFIKEYPNKTSLQIFNAGVLLLDFSVNKNRVCINDDCYAKESVIRKFFQNDSLNALDFRDILLGKVIFEGKNLQKNSNGFTQNINFGNSKITYKVNSDSIFFKENKSKFTLEITNIN